MNASKHTPGPWSRGIDNRIASPTNMVARTNRIYKSHGGPGYPDFLEQEANADLIAAAPDLLDVAKSILAPDMLTLLPAEYIEKVRAAIAKAEGGAA